MDRGRARRKLIAWLALLATCLLVVAPSVSRVAMAAPMAMSMEAMCGESQHAAPHSSRDHHHADVFDACAYCALVSHGTISSGVLAFFVPVIPSADLAASTTLPIGRALLVQRRPARGPPSWLVSGFADR
nr:DUF2946 domain-containing protein [Dyella sp. ASV24]